MVVVCCTMRLWIAVLSSLGNILLLLLVELESEEEEEEEVAAAAVAAAVSSCWSASVVTVESIASGDSDEFGSERVRDVG